MSLGITPPEFVRQVYYAQEKVVLDFWPTDDKYKEVLTEENFVLQELQKEEDWLWLRSQSILGTTEKDMRYMPVPLDFYKQSTLYDDGLRLYAHKHTCSQSDCPNYGLHDGDANFDWGDCKYHCFDRAPFIYVPWTPMGWQNDFAPRQMSYVTRPNVQDITLGASVVNDGNGQKLVFSRPLLYPEINKVAVLQYQRLITPFHICNDECKGVDQSAPISYEPGAGFNPCNQIADAQKNYIKVLTEVPDPFYVIVRTAQYHAEGSPPAQGRIAGLQDQAQKMLSAMRENNAAATIPDTVKTWNPGFWQVI